MNGNFLANRKRILILTSTFPRWKGDKEPPFVLELSKRMLEQFHVTVLAPHAPDAKCFEVLDGIEVHRFRYFFTQWQRLAYDGGILANLRSNHVNYLLVPFFIFFEFVFLVRLLKQSSFDAIHAHWLIPQGLVALAARALSRQRPAIICTSHGGDLFGLSGIVLSWLKRQIIRRVDKLTVVSQAMRDYAEKLSGRRDIEVIPMGTDLTRRFTPDAKIKRRPHLIFFAGRLVEKKGVRYLISAMPEILRSYPDGQLLIAGDGPDRSVLAQLAESIGLAHHVQFIGAIDNAALPDYYRKAAIFAGPSIVAIGGDQEGLGLVFVEALGCECAVIASDLPAIRDVVVDGVTGIVCKRNDSIDLAHKIILLLENPSLRNRLAQSGRQHVQASFDWNVIAHRYTELLSNLTSRN